MERRPAYAPLCGMVARSLTCGRRSSRSSGGENESVRAFQAQRDQVPYNVTSNSSISTVIKRNGIRGTFAFPIEHVANDD